MAETGMRRRGPRNGGRAELVRSAIVGPAAAGVAVAAASLAWAGGHGAAQAQIVRALDDRPVSTNAFGAPFTEPHLAIAPSDPSHWVVGAMLVHADDFSHFDCVALTTFDAGGSWSAHELAQRECGDPWAAVTPNGTALLSVLGDARGVSVFRSADGGRSWPAESLLVEGAHDHQMFVWAPDHRTLYLVSGESRRDERGASRSAVFVAASVDEGRTFEVRGRAVASNLSYEAQRPVVGADGTLYLPLADHHTWRGRRLQMRRSWLPVSRDGGRTFEEPRLISEGCNRRGPAGWPELAGGAGSDDREKQLYWICEAQDFQGIRFHRSEDAGETWGEAVRIDGGPEETWTKTPTIAVDGAGTILVTWQDRRDDPERRCQLLYGAASTDGGATFSAPVPLSSEPSCPPDDGVSARFPAGGDYAGLVPLEPGRFVAVWADAREGVFRLRSARVEVGPR